MGEIVKMSTPQNTKIERIACYIRVSHDEQKLRGLSLDAQRMTLTEYAKLNNMKIVEWYEDEGVSGTKLIRQRPALQRMIHDAEKGLFDRIIFIKLDRYFRSVAEYYECQKILDKHNVLWTATEEKYDLTTANGKYWVTQKLAMAEYEAAQTGERIDLVNEYKVKTGQPLSGSVAFCFAIIKMDGIKRIAKNPDTVHIMEDLLHHIWTYQSKRKAVHYINQKYEMSLSYASVSNLLKNTLLYGAYRDNPEYLLPEHRYMTKEDFDTMQEFLTRQVKTNTNERHYIFSGLITCPHCGRKLKGTLSYGYTSSGNHVSYKRYRCQKRALAGSCDFIKSISENTFERMLLAGIEGFLEDAKTEDEKLRSGEMVSTHIINVDEVQAEINRLNYSWQKGRIPTVEEYDKQYDALMEKLEAAKAIQERKEERDFSKVENALQAGWRGLYDLLDDANKQAFWRSFIQSIEIHWTTDEKRIDRVNFF